MAMADRTGLFQIFAAGTHVDGNGVKREFTEADLADMAGAYSAANHEAPLLVRHNPGDCHGFLPQVVKSGRRLLAEARNVTDDFRQKIKQGWKLSAGLYAPEDPRNPNPGKWAIREVSAVPIPAVKGMRDPSPAFGEDATDLVCIDFSESPVEFMEVPMAENDDRAAELEAREAAIALREQSLRVAEGATFAETQAAAGKILPRQQGALAALHATLGETKDIQFGEGDAKVSPRQLLETLFEKAPKVIEFMEKAKGGDSMDEEKGLMEQAEEYMDSMKAKGKPVSASMAMAYVKKKMKKEG